MPVPPLTARRTESSRFISICGDGEAIGGSERRRTRRAGYLAMDESNAGRPNLIGTGVPWHSPKSRLQWLIV